MTKRASQRAALLLLALSLAAPACKRSSGPKWAESGAPAARVNQTGYLARGPKVAVLRSDAPGAVPVELRRGDEVLWRGSSQPRGFDAASGDAVHHVDFGSYQGTGEGLVLRALDSESFPFRVADDVYAQLPRDALKYFYHNRSGVDIVQPYVPSNEWSRQAGHLSDASVTCASSAVCDYSLDVSGGWYDAGDHGKYVVNGGIAAWTLLALHERLVHLGPGVGAFADGTANIPESQNGVPDLLDEARYEVEFLMRMQVPEGKPHAGMAHHKVHDGAWTPLPYEPPPRSESRRLHPPSTAATLNLAAVAAQAARIFRPYDADFAARCQRSAERAWAAAQREPHVLAPEMDNQGGGAYPDKDVSDEFYWAAVESWLMQPSQALRDFIEASPHHRQFATVLRHDDGSFDGDGVSASMTWQSTAALGWISLAITPSTWPADDVARLRTGIVQAGDRYVAIEAGEGYRLPLALGENHHYPWGSNSFVLDNMLVLSLAADLSGERKYAEAVVAGMDYLLGENPLLMSYVSGYGTQSLQNPHHRFWAHSKSREYPGPPPGAVSGGPNSSLQDPQTKKSGLSKDLPPQKCYVDHIEAWSVNDVAINWNAPLVWVAAYLDEWRGRELVGSSTASGRSAP